MFTFLKSMRIRRAFEFKQTLDHGHKVVSGELVLFLREREVKDSLGFRFGVIVSKKTSRLAVTRNQVKRSLREGFRHLRPEFEKAFGNHDVVVISRVRAKDLSATELRAALRFSLEKAEKKTKRTFEIIKTRTNDTSTLRPHSQTV